MSEAITSRICFSSPFAKVTDKESTRYALAAVHVCSAATPGEVFISATDSKQLTVQRVEGETDHPILIPQEILPTKQPKAPRYSHKPWEVTKNGRWENTDGKFHNGDVEGRFPRCDAVVKDCKIDPLNSVVVTLDVAKLLEMAKAVGDNAVTLILSTGKPVVEDAIRVLFPEKPAAFGLLMPMAGDKADAKPTRSKWRKLTSEYITQFTPVPEPVKAA